MKLEVASEKDKALATPDEYADSNTGWDDEDDTLSFCYFVSEQAADNLSSGDSKLRDSNARSSDLKEDFDFQFDLGQTSSRTYNICSAEDLFQKGRVHPFTVQRYWSESNVNFSQRKSNYRHESRRLLNEKLQAWRTDSSDIQSTSFTNDRASKRKGFHSASAKNFHRGNFVTLGSNSSSMTNRASKPLPRISKTLMKWQQFLTLGLMKTVPVTLEEICLNQGKPNNNGLDNSVLKRSLAHDYRESLMVQKKAATAAKFQQKSKSVKGNLWTKGTLRSRTMFAALKSVYSCKFSSNSVKNCLAEAKKTRRVAPVKADQKTQKLAQSSNDDAEERRHSDAPVLRSPPKKSR